MKPRDFLNAARVPESVKPQQHGLWSVRRQFFEELLSIAIVGWPSMTVLQHVSIKTLHLGDNAGEVVMEDSCRELSRHLPIWMTARGNVLITGLGLGCVVRGLLVNPDVDHIDVIEIDPWIMKTIGAEFVDNPKITLHLGDALTLKLDGHWDCAWHDLWLASDDLSIAHANLILNYRDRIASQGAWAFPRPYARMMERPLLGSPRRRRAA